MLPMVTVTSVIPLTLVVALLAVSSHEGIGKRRLPVSFYRLFTASNSEIVTKASVIIFDMDNRTICFVLKYRISSKID